MIRVAFTLFGRRAHALISKNVGTIGGVFFCGDTLTCVVPAHRSAFRPDDPDSCLTCARAVRAAANRSLRRNP